MTLASQHYPTSLTALSSPKLLIQSPSYRRLALALGVLKSKPADISLDEFVSEVVSRIQAGTRQEEATKERKHLDSAAFWRQAYENSEAAQSKLLDRVYELEQKLEGTSQASKQGTERLNARKRKGEDTGRTGEINGRSIKQRSKISEKGVGASMNTIDDEFGEAGGLETTDVGEEKIILRPFFYLHKAITQRKPDSTALASASAKFCAAASLAISVVLGSPTEEKIQNTPHRASNPQQPANHNIENLGDQPRGLAAVLVVLETKGYPLVLRALGKARSIEDGGRSQRKITHALVTLFCAVLQELHEIFVKSAQERVDEEKEARKKTTKGRNLTLKKAAGTPDLGAPQLISRFLVHMIDTLDASRPESAVLLEGYLACFLNQVGKRLCLITFGQEEMRAHSFRADEDDIYQIRNRGLGDNLRDEVNRRAAEEESGYLTKVLKLGLRFAAANQHLLINCQRVEGQEGREKVGFLEIIKRRLQNTLLKGVFGNDNIFHQSLEGYKGSGSETDSEADGEGEMDEETPGDRFTREVWELVGWDVLTGAIEFTDGEGTVARMCKDDESSIYGTS